MKFWGGWPHKNIRVIQLNICKRSVSVDTSKLTTEFNQYNRRRSEPENTTTTVAGLIFTAPHGLQNYEKHKKDTTLNTQY